MLKAVVFDLGDTLVNTHPEKMEGAKRHVLKKFGYSVPKNFTEINKRNRKEFMKKYYSSVKIHYPRYSYDILLKTLGVSVDNRRLLEMENEENEISLQYKELYPSALEVLEFCKKKNLLVGAISNDTTQRFRKMMENLGLDKYFDIILISEEIGHEKSSLIPFKMFLEKSGLQPEECLMVGNRPDEDMLAKKVGMKTVLVSYVEMPVVGKAGEHDYEITDIKDLPPIIENLLSKP